MPSNKYKVEDVVQALNNTRGMVYIAARQLGCSANTIYNYARKHSAVREAIDQHRGVLVDTAELGLWQAVSNKEAWAIALVLRTLGRQRGYAERLEITARIDITIVNEVVEKLEKAGEDPEKVFRRLIEAVESKQPR